MLFLAPRADARACGDGGGSGAGQRFERQLYRRGAADAAMRRLWASRWELWPFRTARLLKCIADLIMGRAADDRINCAVLLELAKELKEMDFAGTVDLVLSVQEEIGVIGAKQVTAALRPDYCVVLDTFRPGARRMCR